MSWSLMRDFVAAVRRIQAGDRDGAVAVLVAEDLKGSRRAMRVQYMLAAGAVVTGVMEHHANCMPPDPAGGVGLVAARLAKAGADLDSAVIQAVIATHCNRDNEVEVLLVSAERFAALLSCRQAPR